jgi:hypothetical protein
MAHDEIPSNNVFYVTKAVFLGMPKCRVVQTTIQKCFQMFYQL